MNRDGWLHSYLARCWRVVCIIALIAVVTALTWPLWLPWVLRPILARNGVQYTGYEHIGYSGIALTGVTFTSSTLRITAKRIELQPWEKHLLVYDWQVEEIESVAPANPAIGSTRDLLDMIAATTPKITSWISSVRITNGKIIIAKRIIKVPSAALTNSVLTANVRVAQQRIRLELTPSQLSIVANPVGVLTIARFQRTTTDWQVTAVTTWRENKATLRAQFAPTGWWPTTAELDVPSITVPDHSVDGTLHGIWQNEVFQITVDGKYPPYTLALVARGDLKSTRIEELRVNAPGIQATLQQPVALIYQMPFVMQTAKLDFTANLAKLPGVPITGQVLGMASITASSNDWPSVQFDATGRDLILTKDVRCETIEATGTISGREHKGKFSAHNLIAPSLAPLVLTGSWRGIGRELPKVNVTAHAGNSTLELAGAVTGTNTVSVRLAEPVALVAEATWPQRGTLTITGRDVVLNDLQDFFQPPLPDIVITDMHVQADWNDGPASFRLNFDSMWRLTTNANFIVAGDITGDETGLQITALRIAEQAGDLVAVTGNVPVTFSPIGLHSLIDGNLALQVRVAPNSVLWERIRTSTGVEIVSPRLEATLTGTSTDPHGLIQAEADAVRWSHFDLAMDHPQLKASITKDALVVESLKGTIEGQQVSLEGKAPLNTRFRPDLHNAQASLRIEKSDLAPFTRYARSVLSPEGQINAEITLQPGWELGGHVTISNASTRAAPPLPPVRDIAARINLSNRTARIVHFRGTTGGQPADFTGAITWTEARKLQYDCHLTGKNLLLVRDPGLVIRADVDLHMTGHSDGVTGLTGRVNVHDSLHLRELETLIPMESARPEQRPPYFSVNQVPFADWTLDIELRSDQGLVVRSPLLRGKLSGEFRLTGRLAEPQAVGLLTIQPGSVRFPFSTFRIERGIAALRAQNPYRPELDVMAETTSFGYDLRLEVTGTADDPQVIFTSTPPLSSDDILLMITTGKLPSTESDSTHQQRAAQIALLLGREMLATFWPGDSAQDVLTLEVGKHLTPEGNPTYLLEYRLDDHWSLTAERDRFNAVNAGVKFRLFSK